MIQQGNLEEDDDDAPDENRDLRKEAAKIVKISWECGSTKSIIAWKEDSGQLPWTLNT